MTALCLTRSRISLFTARVAPTCSFSLSLSLSGSSYSSGGYFVSVRAALECATVCVCVCVCAAVCLAFIYKDVSFVSLAFSAEKCV